MGIWDDLHGLGDKFPKDPAGTPFFKGDSSNPLDLVSGNTTLGPETAATKNLQAATDRGFGLSDSLGGERGGYGGHYSADTDQSLYNDQMGNIKQLQDTAAGRVPSPVELQLRAQSARNAAGAFGQAAALQSRSPGAALRAALDSSFRTNSDANIQGAIQRAAEQQRAQQALVAAIAQGRHDNFNLLQNDTDWRKTLLDAQLKSLNIGSDAAGSQFKAENTNAAAQNQFNNDVGSGILKGIMSDRTTKTDVKPADLDSLADSLKGFRFRYKDKKNGEGERVGVMAQDAAKGGPIGKRMVNMGGDGRMRLDVGNAVGAALAMSAKALRDARKEA